MNKNKKTFFIPFSFFTVFLLFFILFYIVNKFVFCTKEHYLTYFLPFYDREISTLANFYKNDENNYNSFKKKFNYDVVKYGIIKGDFTFAKLLLSTYISNSYLYKVDSISYDDRMSCLDDLVNNKINFNLNNFSTLIFYAEKMKKNITNLRLVTSLYNLYLYFITKKKHNIVSLNNIKYGCKIGIIDIDQSYTLYYIKILHDMGYEKDDYKIISYLNLHDLMNGFLKDECDFMIIKDTYPNKNIKNFLDKNTGEDIILLPFDLAKEKLFLKKNSEIFIDNIDLNELSHFYLPRKFGNVEYTRYRPNFKICYNHKILLTNTQTDPSHTHSIIEFLYKNWKNINNNLTEKGYKISGINIDNIDLNYLDYHEGVLKYFNEIGLITNTDNDNCKYLIGKMPCNNKTLKENNLFFPYNVK